jgi:glycosyltransferase involved in cell wall biosynthesis
MRILHLIDSGGMYGAEAVLLALADHQQRSGHSVAIASIGRAGSEPKPLEVEAERRGLVVHRVRMANGPNPLGAYKLLALARQQRVEILHSHGYKPNILVGFIPSRIRRVPLVATAHGYTHGVGFNRMTLYRWLDLRAIRRCDRVVLVHGQMIASSGLESLDAGRVRIIENGIPDAGVPAANEAVDRRILEFCRNRHVVGAVGRLSPEKGFDRLIAAFAKLAGSDSNLRLVILGDGSERPALERQVAEANLSDRVLMPGFADGQRHLPLFTVFVLPSLSEGLPLTVLEAMRAGVPIVASHVGGVPAVLDEGRCGVIVAPGDVDGVADGISRILTDPRLRESLVSAALTRVRDYSAQRMAERYLDVYRELAQPATAQGVKPGSIPNQITR